MPLQIIRNDITNMLVDAIVNTTNSTAEVGYGVDYAIHQKAGFQLLAARRLLGVIHPGQAKLTKGYSLPAKYVIHTVCPMWIDGSHGEQLILASCYENALRTAVKHGCTSIAFPLMSAGNLGFPKKIALQIATNAINSFLSEQDLDVYLLVFSSSTLNLSEQLFADVKSYIDEHYVQEAFLREYDCSEQYLCTPSELQTGEYRRMQESRRRAPQSNRAHTRREGTSVYRTDTFDSLPSTLPQGGSSTPEDLKYILQTTDAGFSETLMELIQRSGKKNADIYNRALVDRKLFSKIKNNPNYTPEKPTILAFAIALELDLEKTKMLLERAGYALTHASKFDIIVEFFIKQKNYDIFLINDVLYEFDQPLLGSK